MRNKITNPDGPNATILLPGGCTSKCAFCFWDRDMGAVKPGADYITKLRETLLALPPQFTSLSISGGEPTQSEYLVPVLSLVRDIQRLFRRFERVVLTTNGTQLEKLFIQHTGLVQQSISYINISRHAVSDMNNYARFGFKGKAPKPGFGPPQTAGLQRILAMPDMPPISLSCVIPEDVSADFLNRFVHYAVRLGAVGVTFRNEATEDTTGVPPTEGETAFWAMHKRRPRDSGCPVCRSASALVPVFAELNHRTIPYPVSFKGSVYEPSVLTKGIFEIVIGLDGKPYADWGLKHHVKKDALFKLAGEAAHEAKLSAVQFAMTGRTVKSTIRNPPRRPQSQFDQANIGADYGYRGCGGTRTSACGLGGIECTIHNSGCGGYSGGGC